MVNYWYIKVAGNGRYFDDIEKESLRDNSIGIGFDITRDFNLTTREDRNNIWNNIGLNDKKKELREKIFSKFMNEMKVEDIVFLCKGIDTILYVAEISGEYYYDDGYRKNFPEYSLPHRRHIRNIKEFKTKSPKNMVGTLYKV